MAVSFSMKLPSTGHERSLKCGVSVVFQDGGTLWTTAALTETKTLLHLQKCQNLMITELSKGFK